MANAKAQINPIQLQGAELNLNKFDAEIKPYSGFNKNNSPFVGGCLSNLFTKTETNTTGSSDSVYVDDNGDVYSIQGEGLNWRLEKKDHVTGEVTVINRWNNAKIINVEEVEELPDNTVYYYKAPDGYGEVWITLDVDDVVIHYKKDNYETQYSFTGVYQNYSSFNFKFNADVLATNRLYISCTFNYYDDNNIKKCSSRLFYTDISSESPSITLIHSAENVGTPSEQYNVISNTCFIWGEEPHEINKRLYYIVNQTFKCYIFDDSHQLVDEKNSNSIVSGFPNSSQFSDFTLIFTKELKPGQDPNYVYRAYVTSCEQINGTTNNLLYPILNVTGVLVNISRITVNKNDNVYVNIGTSTLYNRKLFVSYKDYNYNFNNYGVSYCMGYKTVDDKFLAFGVTDNYCTQCVTLKEDSSGNKYAALEAGTLVSKTVLFNNGEATGICSPSGVLLSEWNSVDKDYIFPQYDGCVAWKDINTNKFYIFHLEITAYKVWLRNINGQLVTNLDVYNNAFDLKQQKIKAFAYAWNNRALFQSDMLNLSDIVSNKNNYYYASSVNEYALTDNASLILNPVPIMNLRRYNSVQKLGSILNNFFINFYIGAETPEYKMSLRMSDTVIVTNNYIYSIDRKLIDLPFPTNSDGNVQLSPSLFCKTEQFGNDVFIRENNNAYQLMKEGSASVMSYYLGTLIENLEELFVLQGQYYAIINKQIFNIQFNNGVVQSLSFVVSVENLQFVGNSVYQAYFFSKTNRCLYTFSGANMLSQAQLVDKISEVYKYKYNQSTQSIILITDIGTIVSSNLGMYLLEDIIPDNVFFYNKGAVFVSDTTLYFIQYYPEEGFTKHHILLETCFYGLNNQTVTINDCLYFRLFSEEHEEGEIKVSATTLSLKGRKTEETTFKIKASDWDILTDSLYVRYQPKEQRGLGISFSIDSPFKIASMSIGTQADAVLIDKVSKGAINAPQQTSNNVEW